MTKMTVYLRVQGKRHVFSVMPGVTLEAIIERYQEKLGIKDPNAVQATMFVPLDVPFDAISIQDRVEFTILTRTEIANNDIKYEGEG